nr:hypothetical protein [Paenibacillus rubinfantis]
MSRAELSAEKGLVTSHERLMAITEEIERLKKENMRAWANVEVGRVRTREIRNNVKKLLSEQEESLKLLVMISQREVAVGKE